MSVKFAIICGAVVISSMASAQLPKAVGQQWGEGLGVSVRGPEVNATELARMKEAGFHYVRFNSNWQSTEVLPNTFVWRNSDEVIPPVLDSGMKMIVMLAYGNTLYERYPKSPEAIAAYARFCRLAMQRYQGRGILWEIWNEPNHERFWDPVPNPYEFSTLLKATVAQLRAEFPNEYIMAPGISAFDFPYVETMFSLGALSGLDAFSMHPYRPDPPENTLTDFGKLYQLINRFKDRGQKLDVIVSEWGYSGRTTDGLLDQFRFAPRLYLNPLMAGVPLSVYYDWSDSSLDINARDSTFGLNDYYLNERPTLRQFKFLNQQLGGYTYKGRLDIGDDRIAALMFSNGSQERVLLWNFDRAAKTVTLPGTNGIYEIRKDGTANVITTATASKVPVSLTDQATIVAPASRYASWRAIGRMSGLPSVIVLDDSQDVAEALKPLVDSFRQASLSGVTDLTVYDQEEGSPDVRVKKIFQINMLSGIGAPPISLSDIEAKVRDLPVSRDWTSRPRTLTVEVNNATFPSWRYKMRVLKTTPVSGALEPRNSTGDGVDFVFANPTLRPFAGTIKGVSNGTNWERSFTLPEGQAWRTVTVPTTTADMEGGYRFSVLNDNSDAPDDQRVIQESPLSILAYFEDYQSDTIGGPISTYEWTRNPVSAGGSFDLRCQEAPAGLPFGDAKAMTFTYQFGTKSQFATLQLKTKKTLAGKPYKMTVWVYGDNSKAVLQMRVRDNDKTYHQTAGQKVDWYGWRQVSFNMVDGFAVNLEGTGSPLVALPVTLHQNLIISQTNSSVGSGKLYFANMTVHAS
jgi:hypothetical protein